MNKLTGLLAALLLGWGTAHAAPSDLPDPLFDPPPTAGATRASIILAGGCFWGVQAVFQHVKGVTRAVSGYAGGSATTAHYPQVGSGATGHAEAVEVSYDPVQVTLGQLLKVFFTVAHDPTQLNRQGPDEGSQYRSAIFVASPTQRAVAEGYIAQLGKSAAFSRPIVTTVEPLTAFYAAEAYHQDYARLHPDNPYIAINDLPKVAALARRFPSLYVEP